MFLHRTIPGLKPQRVGACPQALLRPALMFLPVERWVPQEVKLVLRTKEEVLYRKGLYDPKPMVIQACNSTAQQYLAHRVERSVAASCAGKWLVVKTSYFANVPQQFFRHPSA